MKQIRITAKNKNHARAIWAALESQGFKEEDNRTFDRWEAEYLWCEGDSYGVDENGELCSWAEHAHEGPTHTSIDEAILSIQKIRTLKLNDDYTAIVNTEGVEVGCKTFTHDIIHDLSKLCRDVMAD